MLIVGGTKRAPSLALFPTKMFSPFTFLLASAELGLVVMKEPSVTGRNAHVAYVPVMVTLLFAFCSVRESLPRKQASTAPEEPQPDWDENS